MLKNKTNGVRKIPFILLALLITVKIMDYSRGLFLGEEQQTMCVGECQEMDEEFVQSFRLARWNNDIFSSTGSINYCSEFIKLIPTHFQDEIIEQGKLFEARGLLNFEKNDEQKLIITGGRDTDSALDPIRKLFSNDMSCKPQYFGSLFYILMLGLILILFISSTVFSNNK